MRVTATAANPCGGISSGMPFSSSAELGGAAHTLLAPAGGVNRDFILAPGSLYQTHKLLEGLLVV